MQMKNNIIFLVILLFQYNHLSSQIENLSFKKDSFEMTILIDFTKEEVVLEFINHSDKYLITYTNEIMYFADDEHHTDTLFVINNYGRNPDGYLDFDVLSPHKKIELKYTFDEIIKINTGTLINKSRVKYYLRYSNLFDVAYLFKKDIHDLKIANNKTKGASYFFMEESSKLYIKTENRSVLRD